MQAIAILAVIVLKGAITDRLTDNGFHQEGNHESDELVLLQSFQSLKTAESRKGTKGSSHRIHHHAHDKALTQMTATVILSSSSYVVGKILLAAVLLTALAVFWVCCLRPTSDRQKQNADDQEALKAENIALEEDAYFMAVASLVRDVQTITRATPGSHRGLHTMRLFSTIVLVGALICIQAALVYQVKLFVTGAEVADIRNTYDAYEFHMYGSQENHTYLNANGKHRGLPGFFQPELFDSLDTETKREVCAIPLSQLSFFSLILFVWTLTCLFQAKRCLDLSAHVWFTPRASSLAEMMQEITADSSEVHVLVGITNSMKIVMTVGILIPWFLITAYLLWVGSRWLASTNDWASLVGDVVALEFVLSLKELFYYALVPERTKRLCRRTQFLPMSEKVPADMITFIGNFSWILAAISWIYIYIIFLQQVLPEYKWDVHGVCSTYFQSLLAKPDIG